MKNIVLIDRRVKLTKAGVESLEQELGINAPPEYKAFLLLCNGGRPKKNHYPFLDPRMASSDIYKFFTFYENSKNSNLLKEFNNFQTIIPEGFFPIACDSNSNLVCLGVSGSEYGKVYFWCFAQKAPIGQKPTIDSMYLLANNFTDFINSLYSYKIKNDCKGNEITVYMHDKYSLPFSIEAKRYGKLVIDFFAQAPTEVIDYVMAEHEFPKALVLEYEVKARKLKYYRKIHPTTQTEDYVK